MSFFRTKDQILEEERLKTYDVYMDMRKLHREDRQFENYAEAAKYIAGLCKNLEEKGYACLKIKCVFKDFQIKYTRYFWGHFITQAHLEKANITDKKLLLKPIIAGETVCLGDKKIQGFDGKLTFIVSSANQYDRVTMELKLFREQLNLYNVPYPYNVPCDLLNMKEDRKKLMQEAWNKSFGKYEESQDCSLSSKKFSSLFSIVNQQLSDNESSSNSEIKQEDSEKSPRMKKVGIDNLGLFSNKESGKKSNNKKQNNASNQSEDLSIHNHNKDHQNPSFGRTRLKMALKHTCIIF